MKTLICQKFQFKISLSNHRLISSLSVVEKPTIFKGKNEQNLFTPFDPFLFFNNYPKSWNFTIRDTKILHTHLLKTVILQSDIFFVNSLMDWYCKRGAMLDALKLFDLITNPNVISWNIVISGYNQKLLFGDSWRFFCRMHTSGSEPNEITYGSVLSACTGLQAPMLGELVYSLTVKNGFFSNGYVRAGTIDLFAKNYRFDDALTVFHGVWCENMVCWNAIISGAVRNGENWVALGLFRQLCHGLLVPNSFTFSSVLTACAALEELETGKMIQGLVVKFGARKDVFLGTAIIDLYAKCGNMDEAVKEFSRMPIRNVVSWTAMISGFVKKGDSISALKLFREMRKLGEEINSYTLTSVLTACAKPDIIIEAIQIHSWLLKAGFCMDPVVAAALINMHSKIGLFDFSEMVFREIENIKNLGAWAVMISSCAQNQSSGRAVEFFQRMLQEGLRPDKFCSSSVLSIVDCISLGRQIHCYILKTGLIFNVSVGSSLFTMYSKSGSLGESYKVFEKIVDKDCVSWASMIAGFVEHGCADQAIQLFRKLPVEEIRPDQMMLTAVLNACSALHSLQNGKEVHGYAFCAGMGKEARIGGALISMYSRCGALQLARRVYNMLPQKDHVSCSSLISGYAQNGYIEEAVLLFHEMLVCDLEIDSFTLSSVLGAVALFNRSGIGTQLHARITKMGLHSEVSVGSSLVQMYSKCGSIDDCLKAFDQIEKPDLIDWTAMIVSYAQHGIGTEALRLYELMKKGGIRPDAVTFVGVLSACSHTGLVEDGYFHLNSMTKDYGIEPGYRHYACMVDLLGRSGRLKEAETFINSMPIEPDAFVWGTLLAACQVHGDFELGRLAAKKVIELEPGDAGAYVSLSNICADVGQWEEVLKVRSQMQGSGVKKEPGWSFV